MNISKEAEAILLERFGKDGLISLATASGNIPYVRTVDAYYKDGAFYVLTYALSGKMRQLNENPHAAISGEWLTAEGFGENLGFWASEKNKDIAETMKTVFAAWIHNGHTNLEDENTVILKIRLTRGVLFSEGKRYDLDFS